MCSSDLSTGGLTTPATLGTVYLKVPAGFTGSPVSIAAADGAYSTTVASAGTDVTGSLNLTVRGTTSTTVTDVTIDDEVGAPDVVAGGTTPVVVPDPVRQPAPVAATPTEQVTEAAPASTTTLVEAAPEVASAPAAPVASAAPARAAAPASEIGRAHV